MKVKCPICEGRGIVPRGFYETCEELDKSKVETCQACEGRGFDWDIQIQPQIGVGTIEMDPPTPWWEPLPWQVYPPNTCFYTDGTSTPQPFGAGIFDDEV